MIITLVSIGPCVGSIATQSWSMNTWLYYTDVPGGKVNILRGHRIGHSKQQIVYVIVSYPVRFPR
jgi:hypothetical protein